ncbi:putative B3 domain-containing protein At3g24850 [Salvia splendens]|uniref:putative B3 domain-containing protein At3g24850 n=1 Tax=Salvia splendens TaxID=180675 RepID=UPI001C27D20D|nr:putative B3 domain-containing protein At3g24850 [Salvia splendens]
MADEEDTKLEQLAESWQIRLCKAGFGSWDSDPQRIANFLQKEGNEKLCLNIPIDIHHITRQLRIADADIKAKYQSLINASSSSSSSSSPRRLFIRRKLQKSDICHHQNRLSMPCSQVDEGALTAQEIEELGEEKKGKVAVEVVDPEGRRYRVRMKRTKAGGTKSYSYTIGSPWNDIKKANGFKEGMKLEVWAVRRETGQLSFHFTPHP